MQHAVERAADYDVLDALRSISLHGGGGDSE
jgi:hypothetical protein